MKVVSVFSPALVTRDVFPSCQITVLFTPHSFQSLIENLDAILVCIPRGKGSMLERNSRQVYLVFTLRFLACCCAGGLFVPSYPLLSPSLCLHSLTVTCCMVLLSVTVKTTYLAGDVSGFWEALMSSQIVSLNCSQAAFERQFGSDLGAFVASLQ